MGNIRGIDARPAPRRLPALLVVAGLTLTACSGDDAATPATSAAPTTAVPTPPTSAPTVSTESTGTTVTTAVPTTTDSTSATPPPTTQTPPKTTVPTNQAQAEQDVIDATTESWQAFNDALLDPTSDVVIAALERTRTGEALQRVLDIVDQYRSENRKSITNSSAPAKIEIFPESVVVNLDEGSAQVEYCRLGSNIAVEIGGNPDGTDRVIDDSINSYLERDTFVLMAGRWLKSDGVTDQTFQGRMQCDG